MARNVTAAVATALNAVTVRPAVFFEGVYSTGTLRLWSGIGSITWNGYSWTGAGQMLGIAPVGEVSEIRAVGFAVSLTGDASALLSINLGAARQGLAGRVWLGLFDSAGALIADPFKTFEGRLDVPEILDEGERCTISVRYESRLIDLDRARERRYTHEDQQIDYAGDLGFAFVPSLQDMQIMWGRPGGAPVTAPDPPAGGGGGSDFGGGGDGGGADSAGDDPGAEASPGAPPSSPSVGGGEGGMGEGGASSPSVGGGEGGTGDAGDAGDGDGW